MLATATSLAVHGLMLSALVFTRTEPAQPPESFPLAVALYDGPDLIAPGSPADNAKPPSPPAPPKPEPPKPKPPAPAKAVKARAKARPTPAPRPVLESMAAADEGEAEEPVPEVSDAQLAGAMTAGSGPTGRGCDLTRALQQALRRDGRVQAAVSQAHSAHGGRAMWVWNGDWVKSPGQEGRGLAAVRQAMIWEIGFAPEACRSEPMHGLVMISLSDSPGAARLVLGAGAWRWSDLLHIRTSG